MTRLHLHTRAAARPLPAGKSNGFWVLKVILSFAPVLLLTGCYLPTPTVPVERFQQTMAYTPIPAASRLHAKAAVTVNYIMSPEEEEKIKRMLGIETSLENYKQAAKNVIFDDISQSGLFTRVDSAATRNDIDLLVNIDIRSVKPGWGTISLTLIDPVTRETIKAYHTDVVQEFRLSMGNLKDKLIADFKDEDFAKRKQEAEDARRKALAEQEQRRRLAEEARQRELSRLTDQDDSGKELFKLQPDPQFSFTQVTEFLITWKNRHLDNVLRNSQTAELRDYVDQIEHTIFQATDASEKEKDKAQQLIASGANGEHEHTDLARAYRLRIEVLKPILASLKEEIANRNK